MISHRQSGYDLTHTGQDMTSQEGEILKVIMAWRNIIGQVKTQDHTILTLVEQMASKQCGGGDKDLEMLILVYGTVRKYYNHVHSVWPEYS